MIVHHGRIEDSRLRWVAVLSELDPESICGSFLYNTGDLCRHIREQFELHRSERDAGTIRHLLSAGREQLKQLDSSLRISQ